MDDRDELEREEIEDELAETGADDEAEEAFVPQKPMRKKLYDRIPITYAQSRILTRVILVILFVVIILAVLLS